MIPTLVRLLDQVPTTSDVITAILRRNGNLCYKISDQILQELVATLRRSAPEAVLDLVVEVCLERGISALVHISWCGRGWGWLGG